MMLALFPKEAVFLFAVLFILGIIGARIADKAASLFKIVPCQECKLQKVHWNVTSILLHDKRFGLDKDVQSSICDRNWVASIPFRCLRVLSVVEK